MRGASSGRGMVMMRLVSAAGGVRCETEWMSMGLVGVRQA